MKRLRNILTVILLALGMLLPATVRAENTVDVKEIVFGRISFPVASYSTSLPSYLLPAGAMEKPS